MPPITRKITHVQTDHERKGLSAAPDHLLLTKSSITKIKRDTPTITKPATGQPSSLSKSCVLPTDAKYRLSMKEGEVALQDIACLFLKIKVRLYCSQIAFMLIGSYKVALNDRANV
jgi:hypothetical protein